MIYNDAGNPQLNVLIKTYEFTEPENSYAYYFQALYDFQNGNNQNCIENLGNSLKLGFTDFDKMKKDFPESIINQVQKIKQY